MDKIELKVTMEPERLDALRYFCPQRKSEHQRKNCSGCWKSSMKNMCQRILGSIWTVRTSLQFAHAPGVQQKAGALHRHRITTLTRTIPAKMFRPAMTWEVDMMKKCDFLNQDLRSSNRLLSLRHHKDIRCPAPSTYSKQKPAKRRNRGCPNERLR